MRILHAIASVDPAMGGTIEGLRQMAEVHQRQGHEAEVISLDAPDAPWVQQCTLKVHAMGPGKLGKFGWTPRMVPWLKRHAADHDAVVVHGLWQYHGFACWRALAGGRVPYVVFPHGMLDPWFKRQYPLKHLKKWLWWPWADYRVLRDAHAVLYTCQEERALAPESFWLYRARERVVSFGTGAPPDATPEQSFAFMARHPELAGHRLLLFLGRVHEKKGVDLLLHALAIERQAHPDAWARCKVVIAGPADDTYGLAMKQLCTDLQLDHLVCWTGMLQGDLKWGAFRAAEAFILPSHQENFGIAVAEALACRLPVLITQRVNIFREVSQAEAGWICDDTVDGVAGALSRWVHTDCLTRMRMSENAERLFHNQFLMETCANELIQLLEQARKL